MNTWISKWFERVDEVIYSMSNSQISSWILGFVANAWISLTIFGILEYLEYLNDLREYIQCK